MEIFLRILQFFVKLIYLIVYPIVRAIFPNKNLNKIPKIQNDLIKLPLTSILHLIKERKLKSIDIVESYIERIKAVNPHINAVIKDRFEEALIEAREADKLINEARSKDEIEELFKKKPLLGAPCTIKESCAVKGMPFTIGSLKRLDEICTEDGEGVRLIRAAGSIPLLVSSTPEYCFSIETNTFTNGKTLNPYDPRRTCGGSSGGEGALNGASASLFGIGSDVAGSIRIPALFNGIFGHKPTGGLVSIKGHFPNANEPDINTYLQIGPMTRFAKDLSLILRVLAGEKASQLKFDEVVATKDIQIYYATGFSGLNGFLHQSVSVEIQQCILDAVEHFRKIGLKTHQYDASDFRNSTEIALSSITDLEGFPFLINSENPSKILETLKEYLKSIFRLSAYTKDGIIFELMQRCHSFMRPEIFDKYKAERLTIKTKLTELLGDKGVLFFPTFHVPAIHHHTSHLPLWGIDYCLLFNALGLPATHVPIRLNKDGLPIGFQIVAAPFMDKLCLQLATELEEAFSENF